MKKSVFVIFFLMFSVVLVCSKVRAESSLNGNETEVIGYVQGGFSYNGTRYMVPQEYLNQGIHYLKQDGVNLTNHQKNRVFDKIKELTPWAIQKGYLIPVNGQGHKDKKVKETSQLSIKEVAQSSETVMKEMGVRVQIDVEKGKIQVSDQQGRIIIGTDPIMKNTGFYLERTLYMFFCIIMLVGGCICVGCRCHLFAYEKE